jgi:hypothetical protein
MRAALIAVALLLAGAAPAAAAPALVKIGDFSQPVYVASPPNDPRVFVVEQGGLVKIVGGGTFLDVSGITSTGEERGLLSIAFPPDYATSGLFYVFLTAAGTGDLKVLEYARSSDPNRANPTARREFLSIPHGPVYHNGGQLHFGPDGMLYVSTGDGHASTNAQNVNSLLGKILRLDPRTGAAAAGNPHGPVWAYGLRNPWRFTFDRATGDMAIADVGAATWEEIDWAPAPGGGRDMNFGWPDCEGPDPDAWCAIVGGYVVRDPGLPTLNGRYVYGDYCQTGLRSTIPRTGADNRSEPASLDVPQLSSFGEDACARLYAASLNGPVYRIQDGAATPCTYAPPTAAPGADTTAPRLTVAIGGLKTALKRRRLRVIMRCDEPCRTAITTRLRNVRRLKTARRPLAANTKTVVRQKLSRKTVRRLRAALARRRAVRVSVSVCATDAAGNARRVVRRARLKR